MKSCIVGLAALLLLVPAMADVYGDPITPQVVTNGTIKVTPTSGTFHFFEPGTLDVSGTLYVPSTYQWYTRPRLDGVSLPLVFALEGPSTGSGTINGTVYPSFLIGIQDMFVTAEDFALPPAPAGTSRTFSTSAKVTDELVFYPVGTPAADLTFTGGPAPNEFFVATFNTIGRFNGLATATSVSVNGEQRTLWSFDRGTVTFGSASPTPEPATIVLLGSGVVGIILRRLRRTVRVPST